MALKVFLIGSVALLCGACSSEIAPPPNESAGLEHLCQRIDRLVQVLERPQPKTASVESPAAAERVAADATVAALQQRVAALEGELEIFRQQQIVGAGSLASTPRPAYIEPLRREVVGRLFAGTSSDNPKTRNQTLAELLLMGPSQIVQMLGMPTDTTILDNGNVRWEYVHDDDAVYITFVNGQVMDIF